MDSPCLHVSEAKRICIHCELAQAGPKAAVREWNNKFKPSRVSNLFLFHLNLHFLKTIYMTHICKNCNQHYKGNFCSNCGQKADVSVFSFHHIFHEAIHAFTHADKSFLVLLKKLVVSSGIVAYEYIVEGKRKKYFNPFTFFALIIAIYAFVENRELSIKEKIFQVNNEYGHVFNFLSKAYLLISIPLLAFFIWLLHYKKSKLLYSEYTVLSMIIISQLSIFNILVKIGNYGLVLFFHSSKGLDENIFYPILMVLIIAITIFQFHKKLYKQNLAKSLICGASYIAIEISLSMLTIWAVLRHFNGLGILYMYGINISGN